MKLLKSYDAITRKTGVIFVIYAIAYLSLISSKYPFWDDYNRLMNPNSFWSRDGRIFASFIQAIFGGSFSTLSPIWPLSQIIALVFLALTTCFTALIITKKLNFKQIIFFLPIGLFPFIAKNMIYKFDAIHMILSFLLSVLPLFYKVQCNLEEKFTKNYRNFFILSISTFTLIAYTYQSAISIYIAIVIFWMIEDILKQPTLKQLFTKALFYFLPYALGFGLYLCFKNFISMPSHLNTFMPLKSFFSLSLQKSAMAKIISYFGHIFLWFSGSLMGFLFFVTLISSLAFIAFKIFTSKISFLWKLTAIFLLFILLITPLLPIITLDSNFMDARALSAFAAVFSLLIFFVYTNLKGKIIKKAFFILCSYLILLFTTFLQVVGPTITYQEQYNEELKISIQQAIISHETDMKHAVSAIHVANTGPFAPVVKKQVEKYPLLFLMVTPLFRWQEAMFFNTLYQNVPIDAFEIEQDNHQARDELKVLQKTSEYIIYYTQSTDIYIEFNEKITSASLYENNFLVQQYKKYKSK